MLHLHTSHALFVCIITIMIFFFSPTSVHSYTYALHVFESWGKNNPQVPSLLQDLEGNEFSSLHIIGSGIIRTVIFRTLKKSTPQQYHMAIEIYKN